MNNTIVSQNDTLDQSFVAHLMSVFSDSPEKVDVQYLCSSPHAPAKNKAHIFNVKGEKSTKINAI